MDALYLGVDIGTTSAKCLAVDQAGQVLAFAQHPYPLSHPRQGWAEQDPEDYWRALVAVVTACVRACKQQGRVPADIAALALSTQADTLLLVDQSGRPLRPALSWMDTRAEAQCRELLAETGPAFWYQTTGKALAPVSSACKLRWLTQHEAHLLAQPHRFCYVPDFLAFRLCGRLATDVPSASWSPLFSPWQRAWAPPVLELLGLPAEHLPQVVESALPLGPLLPEAAQALGLGRSTILAAGAFDQVAAACGAGAQAGKASVLSCGTAWVLYTVLDAPLRDPCQQVPLCCHASPQAWGLVLPFAGGSVYDWFHLTFPPGAALCTSGEPPLLIPHLYGGLAPDWQEASRGSLLGLSMVHTWSDVERALMWGVVFEARRNLEAAQRLCGPIPALRMVGGAAKNEHWPQMVADGLGLPVAVLDLAEAACYGAAKLAAGEAAAGWGEPKKHQYAPVPAQAAQAEQQYQRYLRFYHALLPPYRQEAPASVAEDRAGWQWAARKESTVTGKDLRLGRLFSGGEHAVVVALDHGEFDGPLPGMIDLPRVLDQVDPEVSAVLLSPGMLPHCSHRFAARGAPLAIVRLNWSTVYCFHWDYQQAATTTALTAQEAVAAGADLVLVSLTLKTGSEERDAANVEVFCRLANEAKRLGLPVVGEFFPARVGELSPAELHEQVYRSCRILAELGADLIKTFYTERFPEVTAACPVPILGLGAEKKPTQLEALELAERIIQDGGKGVVFGRNAIQVPDPPAFQRALCQVVKRGTAAAEAARQFGLQD